MKKIIIGLLIIQCSLTISNAQWIIQPTGNVHPIRDLEFIDRTTGWACGDNHIYKTTNGGKNWIEQLHPDGFLIQQIFPVNDRVVYACGWWNFMKTTNGGENWYSLFDKVPKSQLPVLDALYFINENTGWLTGNVVVMKTTNGGESFIDSMRLEAIPTDMYFKDSLNGIISSYSGLIQKTTNGGMNWQPIRIIHTGPLYDFNQIAVVNKNNVWVGGKSIHKSTNFGETWDSIAFIVTNAHMYGLAFSSLNTGFISGNLGEMYKTTDGGYNWRRENSGTSTSIIYTIETYNDSIVWASRGNGTVIHTITGGQTGIINTNSLQPESFTLYQNYPNPFNPVTIIPFEISKSAHVKLIVFDILGRELKTLINKKLQPGTYEVDFNSENLSSGVYYYKLESTHFSDIRKMIVVK